MRRSSAAKWSLSGMSVALLAVLAAVAFVATSLVSPATADDESSPVLQPSPMQNPSAPEQNPGAVASRVEKLAKSEPMGKKSGTVILDPASGQTLFDDDANLMLTPASSMKIPTAAAALIQIGMNTTIETSVVRAPGSADVYLVGGGDPLLESKQFKKEPADPQYPAATSMNDLATSTAQKLKDSGQSSISLKYDSSLFTGKDWNPDWSSSFRSQGIVAPVQALRVDDARETRWGPRGADPAEMAGERFAGLLRSEGIKVGSVNEGKAPGESEKLAAVFSVPIYQLVTQMLSTSDNDTAEALFRLAGIAGGFGGSFEGGQQATQAALQKIGIPTVLANFDDGSGLSKENKASPSLFAEILSRSLRGDNDLWAIGSGLAVGGVSGTLRNRFHTLDTQDVAGLVRAKTGTLTSTSSLSGFVPTASGRVFVFSSIANEARSAFEAAAMMDKIVAAMAECGCQ
jgi:D-alanyl-D-alanine carboxypeptidase/D-alanyl-D-alanine-endopeptidase (penicillin-binding protein 4)